MNTTIEKPTIKHAKAIASICSEGWKQTVEGMLSEEYQRKNVAYWYNIDRVKKDIKAGTYSYIASYQKEVVGVIGGGKISSIAGEIYVLYVDEKIRYQGIGRKLLEALTEDQLKKGITEQWVSVQQDNHLGIPFYEARGFIHKSKKITETETGEKQVSLRYVREIGTQME